MSRYAKPATRIFYLSMVLGLLFIMMPLLLLVSPAWSSPGESNVKFHGTLVVVSCKVNNGQDVTVDFGESVGIHRIDGVRYKQPIPLTVNCNSLSDNNTNPPLTLTLTGTAIDFDDAAVVTNVSGLGIEIQVNDQPQPLNKAIPLTSDNIPQLSAVPVLQSGTELSAQAFSAGLKLVVEVA